MADERYRDPGGETCLNCNSRYQLWWGAPDDIWMAVVGKKEGHLCPTCFDRLAWANGYSLEWKCEQRK